MKFDANFTEYSGICETERLSMMLNDINTVLRKYATSICVQLIQVFPKNEAFKQPFFFLGLYVLLVLNIRSYCSSVGFFVYIFCGLYKRIY